ncbi:dimethylarginine dimethylaminohydrolase family protein [Candidatus Nitrospira bockiana]
MKRFLVCPPDYFSIEYEINPWMHRSIAANRERAREQWTGLVHELEAVIGARLERMEPVPGLPDMVFTANAGVVHGEVAVPSRFRHRERQGEEPHFERWFREHGYEVVPLEAGLYFEGAGDLLGFPDVWFGGYRQRSDVRAYLALSEVFSREIIPVELVDSRFYHLDTCFCPLSGGELLYYPPAFDPYAQTVIADRIGKDRRIAVAEADALTFACNAVCVGRHVILPEGCRDTMQRLIEREYIPHPLPLDEFKKAGGSAKCLTLALDSSPEA